jgi:steroid delta-isomerase-like uncharacterized protein
MGDLAAFAREWTDAFNAHDRARLEDTFAHGAFMVAPSDLRFEGRDACVGYAMAWLDAFPDAQITVRNQFISEPWIAMEFTFEGTHEETLVGPAGEIPATGRHLVGRGAELVRVEDGKAAEFQLYFDQVQVLMQLGLMPEPATA